MRIPYLRFVGLAAFALSLAGMSGASRAQQNTSATFDDWVLECHADKSPTPRKLCQMFQISRIKENNTPFSRVVLAKAANGKSIVLVAQLPTNVSTRAPVALRLDDADPGVSALLDRCLPAGCFVEFELKDDFVKKLRTFEGVGKLTFKDAGGHDVVVPLSLKGFRSAFEAMLKD